MRHINRLVALFMVVTLTGCSSSENSVETGDVGIIQEKIAEPVQMQDASEKKPETYKSEEKSIHEDSKKDMSAGVEYEGVQYKLQKVEISKKISGHEKARINFWDEQTDEQGNLTGKEQYIWITLNVLNLGNTEQEVLLNHTIVNISAENVVTETAAEARYIAPEQEGMSADRRFQCVLVPGKEQEFELGYIIEEANAHDSLYYCLGTDGALLDNPNNQFLYLGEPANEE